MKRRHVIFRGAAQTAELRTATFDGRDHLVVPVIALIGDAVVRPLGSEGPELVPAEELQVAPASWNGRPVVPDHPHGGSASANDPATLEAMRFGQLFHTHYDDGKLKTEAWIDVDRAAKLGGDPQRVVERCRAGEVVEVSVGVWVTAEKKSGQSPSGEPYEYIWRGVVPDHLAMLPEGTIGACSVEMGCGAPRVARQQRTAVLRAAKESRMKFPFRFLRDMFRSSQEGVSDVALRDSLASRLRATEPGFDWIMEVYPEEQMVVYATMPEDEWMMWRRSYSMDDAGDVSLGDDAEQVMEETRYVPAAQAEDKAEAPSAEEKPTVASGGCGCTTNGGDRKTAPKGARQMAQIRSLVKRLIDCERSPFSSQDATVLAAFSDERLTALAEEYEAEPETKEEEEQLAAPPTPPPVAPPAPDPNTVQLSREEYESMKAAAAAHRAAEQKHRSELVATLAGSQESFSAEDLQAMPIVQLEKLAKLCATSEAPAPDYSLRGAALGSSKDDLAAYQPPDPWAVKGGN